MAGLMITFYTEAQSKAPSHTVKVRPEACLPALPCLTTWRIMTWSGGTSLSDFPRDTDVTYHNYIPPFVTSGPKAANNQIKCKSKIPQNPVKIQNY